MIDTPPSGVGEISSTMQRVTNFLGHVVELFSRGLARIFGRKSVTEAIAAKTRYDVQMDVEDILARNLSVGQVQRDPITFKPRFSQSRTYRHCGCEQLTAGLRREVCQIRSMTFGYDQRVSRSYGMKIKERRGRVVLEDDA